MTKSLEKKKNYESIMFIDGFEFPKPESASDYLNTGGIAICLILTIPIWIIPYLVGKIIKELAGEKKFYTVSLKCPVCKEFAVKGKEEKVKCDACGWHKDTKEYY